MRPRATIFIKRDDDDLRFLNLVEKSTWRTLQSLLEKHIFELKNGVWQPGIVKSSGPAFFSFALPYFTYEMFHSPRLPELSVKLLKQGCGWGWRNWKFHTRKGKNGGLLQLKFFVLFVEKRK